jgi:CHAT domain-containing protein
MQITKIQLCLSLGLLGAIANVQAFNWIEEPNLRHSWFEQKIKRLESKKNQSDDIHRVLINIKLSDLYRVTREGVKAKYYAEEAVKSARQLGDKHILAMALNAYGNIMNSDYFLDYRSAFARYQEALKLLNKKEKPQLYANILINLARLWIDSHEYDSVHSQAVYQKKAMESLKRALAATRQLSNNRDKAVKLLRLSQIAKLIQKELALNNIALRSMVYDALEEVRRFDVKKYPRVVSYAYGYLGELYQIEGRYSDALRLTQKALFYANQEWATNILYRFERQLGQLLLALGKREAAIDAYQRAITYLKDVRPHLAKTSYGSRQKTPLRETVAGKVYLELIELLMEKAKKAKKAKKNHVYQSCLQQVQKVIEQFKVAELENYFQDDCLGDPQVKFTNFLKGSRTACTINYQEPALKVFEDTAVLYPMIFQERLELLVYFRKKWVLVTQIVTQKDLEKSINELVSKLRTINPTMDQLNDLLYEARNLYNWLIHPIATYIPTDQVKTLVIIPDELLRGMPFAVLNDGAHYLIEKYALATTPNLALTQTEMTTPSQLDNFLLNGLSESEAPLDYVEKELAAIKKLYRTEELLNEDFTKKNFHARIKEKAFSVIHIATHGKFRSNPRKSFLWTFEKSENGNSKTADSETRGSKTANYEKHSLKIEDLEKLAHWGTLRQKPVELLTLSACESAKGNDSAALGLSGLAVKAGAKTAVASLWQINDLSTCYFMATFYSYLKGSISKAEALRKTQMEFIEGKIHQKNVCEEPLSSGENYIHPYYWAAFLLIGNWL